MSRRFQIVLTERQYAFLGSEADRSSVSVAELIRRAIDTTYGPFHGERKVLLISHELGRRSGRSMDSDQSSPSK
jgi:hypothetical protein